MMIGEHIQYCDKCGMVVPIDDSDMEYYKTEEAKERALTTCGWCGGGLHFLDNDDILSVKEYNLAYNQAFRERNGYTTFDDWTSKCEEKVIKEFISKLPTYDEYAMYDRLEQRRRREEQRRQKAREIRAREGSQPHCPTCSSDNVKRVSSTSKLLNTVAFGILGTKRHKQFHCNSCGYEW